MSTRGYSVGYNYTSSCPDLACRRRWLCYSSKVSDVDDWFVICGVVPLSCLFLLPVPAPSGINWLVCYLWSLAPILSLLSPRSCSIWHKLVGLLSVESCPYPVSSFSAFLLHLAQIGWFVICGVVPLSCLFLLPVPAPSGTNWLVCYLWSRAPILSLLSPRSCSIWHNLISLVLIC